MKNLLVVALLFSCVSVPAAAQSSKRTWTLSEIIAERQPVVKKKKIRYCRGGAFKPCVCPSDVTKLAQYRPSVKECGGSAAIILSGKYLSVYSAVVRDYENKDRWPPEGANGCTKHETNVLGLNKCSVFKVQKEIGVENEESGDAQVHCLGASGYSKLFSRVSRMTIKLSDAPNSNNDPLVRWCLVGPTQPLN